MAIKKSDLYSSLWASCDELRGGMDASQYKDYVLTLLFVKYVSDKFEGDADSLIVIPEGASFSDMVKLKGDKEIGDKVNKIIGKLAAENDLKGVIDVADFNDEAKLGSGKEMVDRLSKLVAIFDSIDLRANRAEGDDLLGDAYEYLMRHFATESGKSKGQFYTPAEVSRIMAKVVGIGPKTTASNTIYDPTCGSGSLLIKAANEIPKRMTIYGQEVDVSTWALAKMNMILHGHPTADLWRGNTLSSPHFKDKGGKLKTFDFAVANPPFSSKAWSSGLDPDNDEFQRFEYGVPPLRNGDYAFLLHVLKSLNSKGKAAVIMPHGVLFRGNREADIRRNLIRQRLIKGIIGLPANLFFGTGIPACIVLIDKEEPDTRKGIFMIDASRGFMKDGNKNRLRARDIHKIVDVFSNQLELPRYSRMVPITEIANPSNDYNLNIPRYIDSSDPEDLHDLEAHLRGGIPSVDLDRLGEYWQVFPRLRADLFQNGDRARYSEPTVEAQTVRATILAHQDYKQFLETVEDAFEDWWNSHEPALMKVKNGTTPREIIFSLSEDVLNRFQRVPLVDRYAIYQRVMDYWDEVMQDDLYLIGGEGWADAARPRAIKTRKGEKAKESPDLVVEKTKYKMDLVPPHTVIARYFAAERKTIEDLEAEIEAATRAVEEYIEELQDPEDFLEDAKNDKGDVTKTLLKERLGILRGEPDFEEEEKVLTRTLELLEIESALKKRLKEAQEALAGKVLAKYGQLNDDEVKALVVRDKWQVELRSAIVGEAERLVQKLARRLWELEDRYQSPLPLLEKELEKLTGKVEAHLKQMGHTW